MPQNSRFDSKMYKLMKFDDPFFESFHDFILDGIWVKDFEKPEIEYVNSKFWKSLGYSIAEIPPASEAMKRIINKEDLKKSIAEFSNPIVSNNHPDEAIIRCKHKDESTVWMSCRGFVFKGNKGVPTKLLLAFQKITDIIKQEEENRKLLIKIAENYPNSYISIIEKDLTVGYTAGQEFTKQNLNPNDFVGLTLEQVFGDKVEIVKKHYLDTFNGLEKSFELFINNQHQLYKTVPLFDENNEVTRILSVVENITERKNTEIELIREKERVEKSQEELKAALKDALYQKQKNIALLQAAKSIPLVSSFKEGAQIIFNICKNIIGAQSGYVALLSENGEENEVLFLDAGGLPCSVDPELPMPIRGLREVAYKNNDSAYHNDFMHSKWVEYMPKGHVVLDNVLFSPLIIENKTVGIIGLANKPGGFTKKDAELAKSFGHLASLGLQLANQKDILREAKEIAEANEKKIKQSYENLYEAEKELRAYYEELKVTTESLELSYKEIEVSKKKIEESETNFRTFFNSIDNYLFILDKEFNIIEINKAVKEKLKYASEDLVGKNISLIHPESRREEAKNIIEQILAGNLNSCHIPILTKCNKQIQVESYISRGEWNGNPAFFGVCKDITLLKKSEQKFAKTFHLNPAISGISDIETGEYIEVNQAFYDKFGFTKEEVIGTKATELFEMTPEFKENALKSLKAEGKVTNIETTLRTIKGDEFIVLLSAEKININQKDYNYTIAIDITEIKKTEQLKNEVHLVQQASKIKEQFLANMSHEMRTPMTGIIGMTDFLLQTQTSKEQEEYIKIIKDSSESLLFLINDILDLSKIEQGKVIITPEIINVRHAITKVMKLFSSQIKQKNLSFKTNFDTNFPEYISIDKNRFGQVISNLLSNAIKYTIEGTIEINLKTSSIKHGVVNGIIEVVDTGIGIDKENIGKIFNNFTRSEGSYIRETQGAGLGLPISRNLAKLLGGDICVESSKGEGSIFSFAFRADIKKGIEDKSINPFDDTADIRNLNLNILLAEDKIVNQQVVSLILKNAGCKITIANNGLEALNLFAENSFDLILMDIMMPVMDGITTLNELKSKYDKLPPIIGLSAQAMEGDAQKFIDLGMCDYVEKPINKSILLSKLRKWGRK